jgi:hypothetical protein
MTRLLFAAAIIACVAPVIARDAEARRTVRTCRDGDRACDADGVRNRQCVLNVCEAGTCGCAGVGCCMPAFCVNAAHPAAQVSLLVPNGKRRGEQMLEYGAGRWTFRCRSRRR